VKKILGLMIAVMILLTGCSKAVMSELTLETSNFDPANTNIEPVTDQTITLYTGQRLYEDSSYIIAGFAPEDRLLLCNLGGGHHYLSLVARPGGSFRIGDYTIFIEELNYQNNFIEVRFEKVLH